MLLTDRQLSELRQIIADYHTAFVINYFGPQTVPDSVLARLRELGLVNLQGNAAEDAYLYGRLLQQLNTPQAAQMSYQDFRRYLRKHPIPLSPVEQQAVNIAASRGAQYVVGLGNKVATDTGVLVIDGDAELRRRMQNEIKTAVAQGIARRESIKEIKSNIGHATGDWTRDLDRIAATETSRAMNEGLAAELRGKHGHEVEVSVLSRKGCCPECQSAYMGPDGAPIIYLLDDLEANGSNYKKKKADKLPVVPPYHPNCACTLVHVPKRFGYNEDNDMVPRGKLGLRPHAQTTKSMQAEVRDLVKADQGPRRLTWHGLRIHNIEPVERHKDIYQGALETPTGDHICVIGPEALAADAYIAHGALADCIMLGFRNGLQAAMVLGTLSQPPHPLAVSRWSQTPVHELVRWAGGDSTTHIIDQAQPQLPCPLTKADTVSRQNRERAKRRAPRDSLDGRLILPVQPPTRPHVRLPDPKVNLPVAMRLAEAEPKVTERPHLPAVAPQVHTIRNSPDAIGAAPDPDDPVGAQVRLIIRERALRRPVRDLELGQ